MKFSTIFLVFSLAALCAAQPTRPPIVLLPAVPGCGPTEINRTLQCGCFILLFAAPTSSTARERCREVTGVPVGESQSACDPFLTTDGTSYDFQGIIDSVGDVKSNCFSGGVVFTRNILDTILANFAAAARGEQLFILANQLCQIFGAPTSSDVPSIARIAADKPAVKSALLRRFNNL